MLSGNIRIELFRYLDEGKGADKLSLTDAGLIVMSPEAFLDTYNKATQLFKVLESKGVYKRTENKETVNNSSDLASAKKTSSKSKKSPTAKKTKARAKSTKAKPKAQKHKRNNKVFL
ncbi:hypothetical protein LNTAR_20663 [Lentisphaera araneosa HTCC2155]|uniref:Uncharacterized protein n=1 Tax=Lentisphaera araneosa HTCC2155 TaxID=313628 RepID=A6DL55_9BACT|nr:hypothetical protein [Lentisphaera araneosa]EDM27657.1 hypothetical protein LNTAR_20663 [Lentisphaera araneosa HTCC2155]